VWPISGSDEASEASSRESRGGFWISEKPRCDISVNSVREANVDLAMSSWSRPSCTEHLICRFFKVTLFTQRYIADDLKLEKSCNRLSVSWLDLELGK
jgi:hypothetical protein